MVRVAPQQALDPGKLTIREAELAVEWLFRDGAQKVILPAASDVTGSSHGGPAAAAWIAGGRPQDWPIGGGSR